MKVNSLLLDIFSDGFYGLTPPQMLIAGGLILLAGVLTVIKLHGDKTLTRIITSVAILTLGFGIGWWIVGNAALSKSETEQRVRTERDTSSERHGSHLKDSDHSNVINNKRSDIKRRSAKNEQLHYAGRFEGPDGIGISDAEVLLNKQPITTTNEAGDFHFVKPDSFGDDAFATLECRKQSALGVLRASTKLDLSYSNVDLLLKF